MCSTKVLLIPFFFASLMTVCSDVLSVEIRLSAKQVVAVSDALDRFKSTGHHLGTYSIFVTSENNSIDVTLVPDLVDTGPMGAEASNDPEIHYLYDATGRKYRKQLLGK